MERCGGHAPEKGWERPNQMVQNVQDTIGANLQIVMEHPEGPIHTAPPAILDEARRKERRGTQAAPPLGRRHPAGAARCQTLSRRTEPGHRF